MRSKMFAILAASFCLLISAHAQKVDIAISASSTLAPGSSSNFSPENLIDGTNASWSEAAEGSGIGEYIQVDFRYPDHLEYVMIKNGFGKAEYWEANSRIKKLKISNEEGDSRTIYLEDTPKMKVYGLREMHEEEGVNFLEDALYGQSFSFEIEEVYPGKRWSDACITEIGFNTWYYENFTKDDQYINENLYRLFLGGAFSNKGILYLESEWDGYVMSDIEDGYYFNKITSGDGTEGSNEAQVFVHGPTNEYYLLVSDHVSEIDYEHIDFNEEDQDEPVRIESFTWDFLFFDKANQDFKSIKEEVFDLLFDVDPAKHFMGKTGDQITTESIWIAPSEPAYIKAVFIGSGENPEPEIDYYWDGNYFRLQGSDKPTYSPDFP